MATMDELHAAEERGFQEGRLHMLTEFDDLLKEMFKSPFEYAPNSIAGASVIVNTMKMKLKEEQ